MGSPIPYLIFLDSRTGRHAFAYVQDADPATVHIACLTPETISTIGPWPRERADRHTQALQAAGYIAYARVEMSLPPQGAQSGGNATSPPLTADPPHPTRRS